jgi:hypothetical protein
MPLGVTLRMRLLPVSERYRVFAASKARPLGAQKLAPTPMPSTHAQAPLPANVDTSPAPVTLRIRCPLLSHTTRTPDSSNFMSCGRMKLAAVPQPSATVNAPLPTKVDTTPADSLRMRFPKSSAIYTSPLASMLMPEGELKPAWAALLCAGTEATSVVLPALPSPASVDTFQ